MGEPATTFDIISGPGNNDCVIEVTGHIGRENLPRLRGALRYAITAGPTRVFVVLDGADSVDATALDVVACAHKGGLDRGVNVVLQAPNADTIDLLVETGLDKVLPVVSDLSVSAQVERPLRSHPWVRRADPS